MSTTTENVEKFLGLAKDFSVADRYAIAMALLESIAESVGAPKAKGRKAKADGEPKTTRAPTSWNIGCSAVREAIKDVDGYKPPHVMSFAKALKDTEPAWAEMEAEEMVEKYEAWLVDNSDVGSRTSGGSKASKAKEPKVELTDEEKAAKRKVTAEKRKATMAANKAAKAAAEAEVIPESVPEKPKSKKVVTEAVEADPKPKAKKAKKDEKYDVEGGAEFTHEGVTYLRKKLCIYSIKTNEFIGLWDSKAKAIDTDAQDPDAEELDE